MSLQNKVLLVVLGIMFVFIVAIYVIASQLILFQAARYEKSQANSKFEQLDDLFHQILITLDSKCKDWAYWDETYAFVESSDQTYVDENLSMFSMENLDVDLMVFLNQTGEIVFSRVLDPLIHDFLEIHPEMLRILESQNTFNHYLEEDGQSAGFWKAEHDVWALVSNPILKSDGNGPIHGTLIMGKCLDSETVEYLRAISKTEFEFDFSFTSGKRNGDQDEIAVVPISKDTLGVIGPLLDPFGKRVVFVKMALDRAVFRQGIRNMRLLAVSLAGIGTVAILATLGALQVLVLRRISRFIDEVDRIVDTHDLSLRVSGHRGDELGRLGKHVNQLISAIQENQNALTCTNTELDKALRVKSEFLSTMTHELRTPLNAIIGTSSVLQSLELNPQIEEYAQIIGRSSETLMGLINNVLDYSKIDSGKFELEDKEFNLLGVVEDAIEIVAASKKSPEVDVFYKLEPDVPYILRGDSLRVGQVLLNLLGNANKFTESGEICLYVYRNLDAGMLCFEVSDTGIGIPQNRIASLFEPFTQLDSSTTRQYGGTGLGLTISMKLANAMGGSIAVSSKPGVGSRFVLSIPHKADFAYRSVSEHFASKFKPNLRIAVRDVPKPHLSILESIFKSWGFNIVSPEETGSEQIAICGIWEKDPLLARRRLSSHSFPEPIPTLYLTHHSMWLLVREYSRQPILTLPYSYDDFCSNIEAILGIDKETLVEGEYIDNDLVLKLKKQSPRVLLVEDNRMNQRVFELLAEKFGLATDIACDGLEALLKIQEKTYHLLFMDYHMPNLNGMETTFRIREMGDQITQPWIVGFSANVEPQILQLMINSGMNDTLSKPMKLSQFRHSISHYLNHLPIPNLN